MTWTVIVNPAAGRGRTRKLLPSIEARAAAVGAKVAVSMNPDAPDQLAREAAAIGHDLVACGGDGLAADGRRRRGRHRPATRRGADRRRQRLRTRARLRPEASARRVRRARARPRPRRRPRSRQRPLVHVRDRVGLRRRGEPLGEHRAPALGNRVVRRGRAAHAWPSTSRTRSGSPSTATRTRSRRGSSRSATVPRTAAG